mgnify:CR=1 FL=1
MTIKEFFSFKANRFFWINIIAMVVVAVLIVVGTLKGLDIYTRHGEAVIVPDVKRNVCKRSGKDVPESWTDLCGVRLQLRKK